MRIGGSKETLYLDTLVDLPGKACKLAPVHLFAYELFQSSFETGFLSRTIRNRDDHLVFLLLNLIAHQDSPREVSQGFYKTLKAFLFHSKALDKIFCSHPAYPTPDLLIEPSAVG